MLITLSIGYGLAIILGTAGYLVFGGSVWAWIIGAWLGGAVLCLLVGMFRTTSRARSASKTSYRVSGKAAKANSDA